MRLSQFLLLTAFTFIACSISTTTATNDAPSTHLAISSNDEPVLESRRYLRDSKKTSKTMNAEDEERAAPNFKQYLGLMNNLKLSGAFSKLPGLQQLAWLQKRFGDKAGSILNLYNRYSKRLNVRAQM
ncbi:Avirulence (Avh) protein [Phytophthora megakarya]|uniref:RxLR effector protein n=1 Tax=Phytophthora megakarya TaxID=4795 RepID=A0A225VA49_9STRA|nr:Avirulence (Avh) protein [Phytophthora megakarya]